MNTDATVGSRFDAVENKFVTTIVPIIVSLADIDLYKFTMQQVVFHQYPNARVRYQFVCRNGGKKLGFLAAEVRLQLDLLANLSLTETELDKMVEMGFFKPDYIAWLRTMRVDPSLVKVEDVNGQLKISIEGKWLDTILFEIYILSIVNELYFAHTSKFSEIREEAELRLTKKIEMIKLYPQLKISEFGTRRRYSRAWQEHVLGRLLKECPGNIVGTSNVYLAIKFGIKAHGTMAHEFISAHLGLVDNLNQAQKRAFYSWLQEYDKDLGTALTDTFTTPAFFRDFGAVLSNEFSGMRHDSGCPFKFARACINHYKKMGIDPKTKFLIFSDGLDIRKAIEIWKTFAGEIGIAFGIGTNLTNDMTEWFEPLQIVIKLIWCNDVDCVKLSDNPAKNMGPNTMVVIVKGVFCREGDELA